MQDIINDIIAEEGIEYLKRLATAQPRFDKYNAMRCLYTGKKIPAGQTFYKLADTKQMTGVMSEAFYKAVVAAVEAL